MFEFIFWNAVGFQQAGLSLWKYYLINQVIQYVLGSFEKRENAVFHALSAILKRHANTELF